MRVAEAARKGPATTSAFGRNYSAALEQVRLLGLSHSAAAKLARFLLEVGGAREANGNGRADRLRLALTHEEIGQLIGAARETVTCLFSEFKHENLIQVKGAVLIPLQDYIYTETRYRMLQQSDPEVARLLLGRAQQAVDERRRQYKQMAERR